jgi:hypothetical protein
MQVRSFKSRRLALILMFRECVARVISTSRRELINTAACQRPFLSVSSEVLLFLRRQLFFVLAHPTVGLASRETKMGSKGAV